MRFFIILSFMFISGFSFAGKVDILVMGDSWSSFMCYFNSFERVLLKEGYRERNKHSRRSVFRKKKLNHKVGIKGCHYTTKLGAETKNFLAGKRKKRVLKLLKKYESIKVVFFSIGGNDLIDHWKADMSPNEEYELYESSFIRLKEVVAYIKAARPDVKIIISGYDYPNFSVFNRWINFKGTYEKIGKPETKRINQTVVDYSRHISRINEIEGVEYIQHYGLMQYHLGNLERGLEEGRTLEPEEISPPYDPGQIGGDIELESDIRSFSRFPLVYQDNYHLSRFGFKKMVEHVMDNYLRSWIDEALSQ